MTRSITVLAVLAVLFCGDALFAGLKEGEAALRREDYPAAYAEISEAAEEGDGKAQIYLSRMYKNGLGVPQNNAKAFEWAASAAEGGGAAGLLEYGRCYASGIGVKQDTEKARKLYEKAAAKGLPAAWWELGHIYLNGVGVKEDWGKARGYFLKSAELGHGEGMGAVCTIDHDLKKEPEVYLPMCEKGAAKGSAIAAVGMGMAYFRGRGVEKNYQKALPYLRKGVLADRVKSPIALAVIYSERDKHDETGYAWAVIGALLGKTEDNKKYLELYEAGLPKERRAAGLEKAKAIARELTRETTRKELFER